MFGQPSFEFPSSDVCVFGNFRVPLSQGLAGQLSGSRDELGKCEVCCKVHWGFALFFCIHVTSMHSIYLYTQLGLVDMFSLSNRASLVTFELNMYAWLGSGSWVVAEEHVASSCASRELRLIPLRCQEFLLSIVRSTSQGGRALREGKHGSVTKGDSSPK